MLVVVPLQSVEVRPFVLRSIDVVQRVMCQVIGQVAEHKSEPETKVILLVGNLDYLEDCVVAEEHGEES